jgi:hypothetical protein
MRTLITTTLVAVAALAIAAPPAAWAGGNPDAVLALHAGAQITKNQCDINLPDCDGFVVNTLETGFFNIYLTVSNYDSLGVAGVQFGIDYDDAPMSGVDIENWISCSDLEFANADWPAASTGNMLTWEFNFNCQIDPGFTTPAAAAPVLIGVLQATVYSMDELSLTPRPVDGRAKVADCLGAEDDITDALPSRLGRISFGQSTGYNPCQASVAVEPTTWGSLKSLFQN